MSNNSASQDIENNSAVDGSLVIPDASESIDCPLCERNQFSIVGSTGRFGMKIQNVCCDNCGCVYINPRPSAEAMAEYYAGTYRLHYREVGYLKDNGEMILPGSAEFEQCRIHSHESQAHNASIISPLPPGAKILEIGCRDGSTLAIQKKLCQIQTYGVEPGTKEAEQANNSGIDCFNGIFEDFDPGDMRFDQVQSFHVLEHLHQPLEALIRFREYLLPGGKLLIEVPNVYQPYGSLQLNFFQNVHLVNYSANTLAALIKRAGFKIDKIIDQGALLISATRIETTEKLPLDFNINLLDQPEELGPWVSERLDNYDQLEQMTAYLLQKDCCNELLAAFSSQVSKPAFSESLAQTTVLWVETLISRALYPHALFVLEAVIAGPHPAELKEILSSYAGQIRQHLGITDTDTSGEEALVDAKAS